MKVSLSWPDKRLSPNARQHWAVVAKLKKLARNQAWWETKAAPGFKDAKARVNANDDPVPVTIVFTPPDARLRDADNMLAAMKAALDGLAEALGVDDHRFRLTLDLTSPANPGRVEVSL